jgi:hypothetical protein
VSHALVNLARRVPSTFCLRITSISPRSFSSSASSMERGSSFRKTAGSADRRLSPAPLGEIVAKGKAKPIAIFEVLTTL